MNHIISSRICKRMPRTKKHRTRKYRRTKKGGSVSISEKPEHLNNPVIQYIEYIPPCDMEKRLFHDIDSLDQFMSILSELSPDEIEKVENIFEI